MGALLLRLFGWLGGTAALKFVAQKALATTLLTTVLAVVLWNFGVDWVEAALDWGLDQVGGVQVPGQPAGITAQLTGVAGYLGSVLKIPECVAFIMSATMARFSIRLVAGMVPGLGGLK